MRYRKLDDNGDYRFGASSSWLVDRREAVAQAVLTRVRLYAGEWFLDAREGLDLTNVLGYGTQNTRDHEVQQRILGTRGVTGISAYSSGVDPATRRFTVSATIDTVYGTTTISEAIR